VVGFFSRGEIIVYRVSENSGCKKGLNQIQDISLYDKIRQKHPLVSDSTNNRRSVNWEYFIGLLKCRLIFVCN